jgi:hypothetical protein
MLTAARLIEPALEREMPRALTIYLMSTDVPKRKALQKAVDDLKLGLTLDEAYMPFEMAGYLPCILNGEDAGFDMWFKNRPSEFTVSPALQSQIGDRGVAILCKWGGDSREAASALIVCAALVKSFDAIAQEGNGDTLLSSEQLLAKANAALA